MPLTEPGADWKEQISLHVLAEVPPNLKIKAVIKPQKSVNLKAAWRIIQTQRTFRHYQFYESFEILS
jgi:hypothetical protein